MATERQIQANRANAAKSTSPITPAGKRASSQNAARHLLASAVVLKGESTRRFNHLALALLVQFQPRNSTDASLVQSMTAARWRLQALALQLRYEAANDRQYNRALALHLKLRTLKLSDAPGSSVSVHSPLQLVTETWDDDSQDEPNFDSDPGREPACNEEVPDATPNPLALERTQFVPGRFLRSRFLQGKP